MKFKDQVKLIIIPGWRTKRAIVNFESDGWSLSKKTSNHLFKALISIDQSLYDSFEYSKNLNNLLKWS